jgi:hypothetical protein
MSGSRIAAILALVLVSELAAAQESNFGDGRPEERYFTVEASVGAGRHGPVAEGYVVNRYHYLAQRVRVTVQPLDAAGQPFGTLTAYVGDVAGHNRTFFSTTLPPGTAGVRASVTYFEWAPGGGSGGGGGM